MSINIKHNHTYDNRLFNNDTATFGNKARFNRKIEFNNPRSDFKEVNKADIKAEVDSDNLSESKNKFTHI